MRRPAEQRRGAALASVVLLLSIGGARPAAADEEPAARSAATVEAERRQVTTELEDIDEGAPGATERRKLLERLDRHLLQQLDELSRADDIADEVRTGESEIDRSGVFRFREGILTCPESEIVTHPEGNTRLYRRPALSSWAGSRR